MAITITHRVSCHLTTNVSSYATDTGGSSGAYQPAASSLVAAFVIPQGASLVNPTSVTGHGLTYTKATTDISDASAARISLWVADAGASPTNTTVTATWASGRTGCHIMEFEITGADLSGGATGALVQTPTGGPATATSGSMTFSAAGNAANRPIACYHHAANEVTGPDGSWTEGDDGNFGSPASGGETQFVSGSFITASTATWTTSSLWIALGAEIKATVTAAASLVYQPSMSTSIHPALMVQ